MAQNRRRQPEKTRSFNRRTALGVLGAGALGTAGLVMWKNRSVSLPSALETLSNLPATDRLPAVFVGHGTPWSAIRPGPYTETWTEIGRALPRPEAILMISAHWLTRGGAMVTANETPRMNYDMYGFPEEMYRIAYPSPGHPELAGEIATAMDGSQRVLPDSEWGYDHGTWLPLMYMLGAQEPGETVATFNDSFQEPSVSMKSFVIA